MSDRDRGKAEEEDALPEYLSRKGEGTMGTPDVQAVIASLLTDAAQFADTELSTVRTDGIKTYQGQPFGNEEDGRSQIILTELRDAIIGILPDVLRVFFSGERAAEFTPAVSHDDQGKATEQAEQASDYVQYVFEEDNAGFLIAHSCIKDALMHKLGFIKWGRDREPERSQYAMSGVSKEQMTLLAQQPGFSITRIVRQRDAQNKKTDLFDIECVKLTPRGKVRIWAVPPEEMLFSRDAKDIETCAVVAHRTERSRGQLLAMGIKKEDLEEVGVESGNDAQVRNSPVQIARRNLGAVGEQKGSGVANDVPAGDANDRIVFTEAYAFVDYDGDGYAELRKFECVGTTFRIVRHRPAAYRPFAAFTADPEPHWLVGGSWTDRLKDLQLIRSSLARGVSDSLSLAIHPRPVFKEGAVNVADVLNTAMGAPIREYETGAVREFAHTFVGGEALPILDFYRQVGENRVGRNNTAEGLDADALQSTTGDGVKAAIQGSQAQAEMLCRIFAEMTLKPLFRGILRESVYPEAQERIVRLRGRYVPVNPASFDPNMDISVNVGLGATNTQNKVQALLAIAAKQAELLSTLGIGEQNPLVTVQQYSQTLSDITRLQGFKNTSRFFNVVPPDWKPAPPPPPPPSEAQLLADAEMKMEQTKTLRELTIKKDELSLKEAEGQRQFALEMKKLEIDHLKIVADTLAKKYATDAQFHSKMADADFTRELSEMNTVLDAAGSAHDRAIAADAHAHKKEMDVRAADNADATTAAAAAAPETGAAE